MSSTAPPRVSNTSELQKWCTHDRGVFFDLALDYCTSSACVLDIGAGEGDFASRVKSELHLIEGNPESVNKLQEKFPNANVVQHSLPEKLPYVDQYFDVIHCSHLVEHLQPKDLYALLSEVNRVLKVDGVFVVSAPLLWSGFYDDLSHVRPYSPHVFRKYLCQRGSNPTRGSISDQFCVEKLIYRYSKRPPDYYDISQKHMWAKRFLLFVTNNLRQRGFSKYEVSGFTMVLRKSEKNNKVNE